MFVTIGLFGLVVIVVLLESTAKRIFWTRLRPVISSPVRMRGLWLPHQSCSMLIVIYDGVRYVSSQATR